MRSQTSPVLRRGTRARSCAAAAFDFLDVEFFNSHPDIAVPVAVLPALASASGTKASRGWLLHCILSPLRGVLRSSGDWNLELLAPRR